MATKIIYFTVNGRPEQAEFPLDCPAQDVKGRSRKQGYRFKLIYIYYKMHVWYVCMQIYIHTYTIKVFKNAYLYF